MAFPPTEFIIVAVIMVVVFLVIAGGAFLCNYLYYVNADEETQARIRMRAEGTIPVVVYTQNRGEASNLLGDQNRDPPPAYNTMNVENEIRSPPTYQK